ncbi:hypothetical protein BJ508DRAFT_312330 [Ascobolus immersus RN42]|uniref:Uncharacterized protein n=1 Tax=Ascobolus immersus RN42 TaxID=1160509 RepID=A0A3N4HRB4_ASCIM|nr:hypothetical protein BJ508DRAFT_312330 [Ascobolus immersus RN42]
MTNETESLPDEPPPEYETLPFTSDPNNPMLAFLRTQRYNHPFTASPATPPRVLSAQSPTERSESLRHEPSRSTCPSCRLTLTSDPNRPPSDSKLPPDEVEKTLTTLNTESDDSEVVRLRNELAQATERDREYERERAVWVTQEASYLREREEGERRANSLVGMVGAAVAGRDSARNALAACQEVNKMLKEDVVNLEKALAEDPGLEGIERMGHPVRSMARVARLLRSREK